MTVPEQGPVECDGYHRAAGRVPILEPGLVSATAVARDNLVLRIIHAPGRNQGAILPWATSVVRTSAERIWFHLQLSSLASPCVIGFLLVRRAALGTRLRCVPIRIYQPAQGHGIQTAVARDNLVLRIIHAPGRNQGVADVHVHHGIGDTPISVGQNRRSRPFAIDACRQQERVFVRYARSSGCPL